MSSQLKTLSGKMLPAIQAEMRTVLQSSPTSTPDSFHGMMHYHMGWVDEQFSLASVHAGKQIRPLLCLLACQAAGGNWQQALPAAAAIELLHNFSLIHDDIEDRSDTRRGRPTVWKVWGMPQGINTGDAMFAFAHLALNRLVDQGVNPAIVVHALRRFDETCVELTQGQHADMQFETRNEVSVDDYVAMITGKTAVLLAFSAEIGALIAGANAETVSHYAKFGRYAGLAFQVKDDILGIWGDEALTGKSAASDILARKKTLPILHALEQSKTLRAQFFSAKADDAFVPTMIKLIEQTNAYQYTVNEATRHTQAANKHLAAASPQGDAGQALSELSDMLLKRNY